MPICWWGGVAVVGGVCKLARQQVVFWGVLGVLVPLLDYEGSLVMLQLSHSESRLGKRGSMSTAEGAIADADAGLWSTAAERIVTFLSYSNCASMAADSSKHCLSSTQPTCRCSRTRERGLVLAHQQEAVAVAPMQCRLERFAVTLWLARVSQPLHAPTLPASLHDLLRVSPGALSR